MNRKTYVHTDGRVFDIKYGYMGYGLAYVDVYPVKNPDRKFFRTKLFYFDTYKDCVDEYETIDELIANCLTRHFEKEKAERAFQDKLNRFFG
jgi:hypothetical protein